VIEISLFKGSGFVGGDMPLAERLYRAHITEISASDILISFREKVLWMIQFLVNPGLF
jgi:hypothetical protein